ncbi:MAG: hypothetical protein II802_02210 [Clostridia bacterium]|nr:hypothetical protein [Clostridia bacterium]
MSKKAQFSSKKLHGCFNGSPCGSVVIMDYMGDAAMAAKEKYINICSNMWKIRNMDLSPADRAYYNEVAARIDKKYAELNQNQ